MENRRRKRKERKAMAIPGDFEFLFPVKIHSGVQALAHLPFELESLDARRPLVLAGDPSAAGIVIRSFRDSGMTIGVIDRIPAVPDLSTVEALAAVYRDNHCDALVAVGSGGVVDTAKVVNIRISCPENNLDRLSGTEKLAAPLGPLVVVPTACATFREVTRFAAVEGLRFESRFLMPDLVVVDPRMLKSGTIRSIISAAMGTLTCAAESCTEPVMNPAAVSYAFAAVELVRQHLMPVVQNRSDRNGRLALVTAAMMAGGAFSNVAAGMAHQLGRAGGGLCDLPTGICMGLLLPYALEYNTLKKHARTATLLLPLAGPDVYASAAENLRAPVAVNMLYALQYDLSKATGGKIPMNLKDAGVEKPLLEKIAQKAVEAGSGELDWGGCRTILHHAWEGRPIVSL